jgi:hypothetical protein
MFSELRKRGGSPRLQYTADTPSCREAAELQANTLNRMRSPRHPVGVDISGFLNVVAQFKRMQESSSVKKLLAYEQEVDEGFAKTS